ncbi:MAG: TetR/AcrR family transcriptional regulator [Acidimicrobiales bacterium]
MATETKTIRSRRTRAALITAVHKHLETRGTFTAADIAADVGCTVGTFWAHFENKDDAIAAAFSEALDELVTLTGIIFGDGPRGLKSSAPHERQQWASEAIDQLIGYFASKALLYRLAISRLPEHRPIREAYRRAEAATVTLATEALPGPDEQADGEALVSFCQGINNPIVLRSKRDDRVRERLGLALTALTTEHR